MNWFSDSTGRAFGAIWKWKWTFLVPVATLILPATIYALRQPKTYKATAVIQINEKQSGSSGVLPGTRDKTAYALVNQARDRLLTSENMKPAVAVLAPGADPDNLAVLQKIAKAYEFDRMGDNSFSVSLIDTDPVIAQRSVNVVCEAFLENEKKRPVEEARLKHEHAEKQLARARDEYKEALGELNAFRDKHIEARGSVQENLRRELANVRRNKETWRTRVNGWRSRLDKLKQELSEGHSRTTSGKRPESAGEIAAKTRLDKSIEKLNDAEAELQSLLGSKTEGHPQVIAGRETVRRLEETVKTAEAKFSAERGKADREWRERSDADLASQRQLKLRQVEVLEADIAEGDRQMARLDEAEDGYFDRLEKAPEVQDMMAPLLEAKNLAFKSVEEAQKISSAEKAKYVYYRDAEPSAVTPFAIIQPAQPPVDPHGPRRMKWLVLAMALGVGIGYGLMLLRRRFERNTITRVDDLAGMLPGALVVPVPRLEQGPILSPTHLARDVVMGGWVVLCLGITGMAVATHRGMLEGPEWLRAMIGV